MKTAMLIVQIGILIMLGAFFVVGFQGYEWLKTGMWPSAPLSAIFHPTTSWVGLQKVIDEFLQLSIAWYIFFIGCAIFSIGDRLYSYFDKNEKQRNRDKINL